MRIAVSNIAWGAGEDIQAAAVLRAAGAEALEVAPGRIFDDLGAATLQSARKIAERWRDAGMPIVSMQALLFGQPDLRLFGDKADEAALLDHLGHVIALAGALGCGPLVFGSPRNRLKGDRSFADATKAALPVLRHIGDLCAEAGTTFCLEANAADYGCDFMTRLEQSAEVATRVAHPAVALVVDTGNMILACETPEAAAQLGVPVAHVHASAPQLATIAEHADYIAAVLGHLGAGGYDGTVTLEMRQGAEGPAALEHAAKGLTILARLVHEAAP